MSSSNSLDNVGHINKRTFLVTTTVLFVAVLLSLGVRLYVRLRIQKQFSVDDGFIVFGVFLLIAAMGMLYHFVDMMFVAEALLLYPKDFQLSFELIQVSFEFQKWAAVSLITTWVAINTVKLSFLALFRKLVDRIRPLVIYWWFVLVYTIVVGCWGVSAYIVPCPVFYSFAALSCSQGHRIQLTLRYSIAQMALDVLGDILILIIPIHLIWKIHIKWTQKIALSFSLCLSTAMIAVTLTRAAGLVNNSRIDVTWETFWQYLSAEVGLVMSTATAFRTFFVSRSAHRHGEIAHGSWYSKLLRRLRSAVSSIRKSSKMHSSSTGSSDTPRAHPEEVMALPQIPRPTMTGIRTFIGKNGRSTWTTSQTLRSQTINVDVEDAWALSNDRQGAHSSEEKGIRSVV